MKINLYLKALLITAVPIFISPQSYGSIDFYINPYACGNCLLALAQFEDMEANTQKRLFFSDKLSDKEIQEFLIKNKSNSSFNRFNFDSLVSVYGNQKVQSGLIVISNQKDTITIPANHLYKYFPFIQQLYPAHDSTYSESIYENAGQNSIRTLQGQKMLVLNTNSLRPRLLMYSNNELKSTMYASKDLEKQLYYLVHGDTDRLWLWRRIQFELSQRSNMKFITLHGFIGEENDLYIYGSYNSLDSESTTKDVSFTPKTFYTKIYVDSIGLPFLINVNFGKGETNYLERDFFEIEHLPQTKRDTSRFNKGLLSYTYQISTGKIRKQKISKQQCNFLPSPLIELDYLNPVKELAVKGNKLMDYSSLQSHVITPTGSNIMFVERCDLGYFIFTYNDDYSFYIDLFDVNSGFTYCCYWNSFHSMSSNVDFRGNMLHFTDKNGFIHRVVF